jgi:hypothetical protein
MTIVRHCQAKEGRRCAQITLLVYVYLHRWPCRAEKWEGFMQQAEAESVGRQELRDRGQSIIYTPDPGSIAYIIDV